MVRYTGFIFIFLMIVVVIVLFKPAGLTGAIIYDQRLSILATNCSGNYTNSTAYPHWNISSAISCENETLAIVGNVTILNGGNLTLRNTTFNMSQLGKGQAGINVLQGGAFYALQNSKITSNDSSLAYVISTSSNLFSIDNSTVSRIGAVDPDNCPFGYLCGIYVNASVNCRNVEMIRDSTINHGGLGIVMAGDNCVIARNTINNISDGAVNLDSSSYNNTIINNNMSGFSFEENNPIVLGGDYNVIDNNTIIGSNQSTVILIFSYGDENNIIRNNVFRHAHRGIRTNLENGPASFYIIANNTLHNISVTAIEIAYSARSIVIKGNSILNTSYGAAAFYGIDFEPGQIVITGNNSNITIQDNIITSNQSQWFGIWINSSNNITFRNNSYSNNNLTIIASTNIVLENEIQAISSYIIDGPNLTLRDTNEAEIFFLQQVNANGTNLSTDIIISNNSLFVNSSKRGFNLTANITFYNTDLLSLRNKFPYLNGNVCNATICTMLSRNDTFVFNVTHFTNYSLGEGSVPNVSVNTPTNNPNLTTQNQLFNVSVTDTNTSISTVLFMFNSNATPFNRTASNTSGSWNVTVNMSSLVDGRHNATVYVNNSFGFVNQSVNISFTVDRTGPRVIISVPTAGSTIREIKDFNTTIRENLSDVQTVIFQFSNGTNPFNRTPSNTSGIWNLSINTSIIAEGALTFTVFANDSLNNLNNTQSITLTVDNVADTSPSSSSSSSSSGGGGGGYGGVSEGVSGSFEKKTWAILAPGKAFMDLENSALPITKLEFTAIDKVVGVWVSVAQPELPEVVRKRFYNLYFKSFEITTSPLLKPESVSERRLYFEVAKGWLSDYTLTSEDIALFRYSGSEWIALPTSVITADGDVVRYKAETPGFSYFIIGEKDAADKKEAKATLEGTAQTTLGENQSILDKEETGTFLGSFYVTVQKHSQKIKLAATIVFIISIIVFISIKMEQKVKNIGKENR